MQNLALTTIFFFLLIILKSFSTSAQALCSNGKLRLTGGPNSQAGRLEICFNNQWGSVCAGADQQWTQDNAVVVCKQLGFSDKGAIVPTTGYYGSGEGTIHLSDVKCSGEEQQLTDCVTSLIGEYNCTHSEDVSVVCQEKAFSCDDGEVRLTSGRTDNEGRIEICYNDQFGTVCDDYWDQQDANVVCKQLGFSGEGAIPVHKAAFGPGYGPVYLDDLQCKGDEPHISQCGHNGVSDSNCQHSEDAGVICKPLDPPTCHDGEIRLVNGRVPSEGRVEVCYNGVWGTICHDLWDDNDASVVCNQLGYTSIGARAVKYADFGEGQGVIFLDSVKCSGTEKFLNECTSDPLAVHNCGHNKDSGVICQDPSSTCVDGDVRLANSTQANAGRVEVCYNNHYGTVCEDNWSTEDANVVCGQLGYEKFGAIALKGGYYGDGVGMIYLDNVKCTGDESDLLKCDRNDIGTTNCYHHQDAAVICKEKTPSKDSCTNGGVRLVGGTVSNEGAIEVCVNGVWTTVCGTGWDDTDAQVICNQLEFPQINKSIAIPSSNYDVTDDGTRTLSLLSNVSCTGNENNLFSCKNTITPTIGSTECATQGVAGVICAAVSPDCKDGDIRLADGVSTNQGRVEVCYNGVWGSVCSTSTSTAGTWSQKEAAVVCHQMGYNLAQTRPVPVIGGNFGTGSGPVFLSDVHCYGNENTLGECIGANFGYQSCPHTLDVGVACIAYPCVDGDVRLVGGDSDNEGRLEICSNGAWKMVCANSEISSDHAQGLCTKITGPSSQVAGAYAMPGLFAGVSVEQAGAIRGSLQDCSSGNILECIKRQFTDDSTTCGRHNSIGLICTGNSACKTGDVRLVGGASSDEGRVEVCLGGEWGTVCDDSWDQKSATVICNQLGHSIESGEEILAVPGGIFESASSETGIFMDNMRCTGSEDNLLQCLLTGVKNHNCQHNEDAGVKCKALSRPPMPSTTTTIPATTNDKGPTPTDDAIEMNHSNNEVESETTPDDTRTDFTIPVIAMGTIIVLIIAVTVIAILIYKWRRLKILVDDRDKLSAKPISSIGSPLRSPSPA